MYIQYLNSLLTHKGNHKVVVKFASVQARHIQEGEGRLEIQLHPFLTLTPHTGMSSSHSSHFLGETSLCTQWIEGMLTSLLELNLILSVATPPIKCWALFSMTHTTLKLSLYSRTILPFKFFHSTSHCSLVTMILQWKSVPSPYILINGMHTLRLPTF
jgi:hypothetical protein